MGCAGLCLFLSGCLAQRAELTEPEQVHGGKLVSLDKQNKNLLAEIRQVEERIDQQEQELTGKLNRLDVFEQKITQLLHAIEKVQADQAALLKRDRARLESDLRKTTDDARSTMAKALDKRFEKLAQNISERIARDHAQMVDLMAQSESMLSEFKRIREETLPLTSSRIERRYSPSVVGIFTLDEDDQPLHLGSGFFINAKGNVATNHRVLEGKATTFVKTAQGETGEVLRVLNYDPKLDLLVADTTFQNTAALPLGDSDAVAVDEDVVIIGSPIGLEGTISKGIISGFRVVEGTRLIQITAPISAGNRGGPVFNLTGEVIGIATASLSGWQNVQFAVPVNYLKDLSATRVDMSLKVPKLPGKTIYQALRDALESGIVVVDNATLYWATIEEQINDSWAPPPVSMRGDKLETVVKFKVDRSGAVSGVEIERPSGNKVYDSAAIRAVQVARRFEPFPEEITDTYVNAHFTFIVGEEPKRIDSASIASR